MNEQIYFGISIENPIVSDGKITNVVTSTDENIFKTVSEAESECLRIMITCISAAVESLNKNVSCVKRELGAGRLPMYAVNIDDKVVWFSVICLKVKD